MNRALNFYKTQGPRTKVKKGSFAGFPKDIAGICKTIQGIIIHPGVLDFYNLNLPPERIESRCNKGIQESIDQIRAIKDKPLATRRKPADRVVNICRHFAMFLCSVLRERGIPARCRCGFATYFVNGWFEDHWICEYWNNNQKKWIKVDPQIDEAHVKVCCINKEKINPIDLPSEAFFPGAVLWQLYRQNLVSGKLCGFSLEKDMSGEWYIRGNMLRDFFALKKMEYTYQEESKLMSRYYRPNKKDLKFLDNIADLTLGADENIIALGTKQ